MTGTEQAFSPDEWAAIRAERLGRQLEDDLRWMLDHHTGFGWDRKGERMRRIVAIRERLGYYDEAVPDDD